MGRPDQPRSQGLSSLPPLVVGTETLGTRLHPNNNDGMTSYIILCLFVCFLLGCRHGSFQLPGTLNCPDDYIDEPLYYGAYFTINVPSAIPQDTQCR